MAVLRDRPYGNSNFLVDFGQGDPREVTAGFSEVVFPPFAARPIKGKGEPIAPTIGTQASVGEHLILKRGLIGSLDLQMWWNKTRRAKTPVSRTVTIQLLSEDQSVVVMTWRFLKARVVCLSYSPLRAAEGSIVTETLELTFDDVEIF